MKRIIIIAVLAYLVYYLNKKNTGATATTKGIGSDPNLVGGNLDSTYGPGNYIENVSISKEIVISFGAVSQLPRMRILAPSGNRAGFRRGEYVRFVNSKFYPDTYLIDEVNVIMSEMPSNFPDEIFMSAQHPYVGNESGLIMVRQNTASQAEPSLVDPVGTSNANIAALQTPVIPLMDRIVPIIEERVPSLTGDTPYWMPNQEMIQPRGLEFVNQY